MTKDIEGKAYRSVVQQWKGGERKLAGARASELIYGKGNKPNEALLAKFQEEIPQISDFISAPVSGVVVDQVVDKGDDDGSTPANLSSDTAKNEQDAIDDVLKPGREAREKTDVRSTTGSTELNPPEDKPVDDTNKNRVKK